MFILIEPGTINTRDELADRLAQIPATIDPKSIFFVLPDGEGQKHILICGNTTTNLQGCREAFRTSSARDVQSVFDFYSGKIKTRPVPERFLPSSSR